MDMKVAVVSQFAIKGIYGDYEYNLCSKLEESGIEVTSLTLMGDNSEFCNKSRVIGGPSRLAQIYSPSLLRELSRTDYDIVHLGAAFWSFLPLQVSLAKRLAWRRGPALVLTSHAFHPEFQKALAASLVGFVKSLDVRHLIFGLRCQAYYLVDHLICMSEAERIHVVRHMGIPSHKVSVVPNGVDLRRFSKPTYDFKKRHELRTSHLILFVGQLIEMKGIPYLLEAFKRVLKEGYDACLAILSYNAPTSAVRALEAWAKQSGVRSKLLILRGAKEADLLSAYRACDLLVIPSIFDEASSTVALEAMASGKPVVASSIDGMPQLVRDGFNGYLVRPRDAEGLARKIMDLLCSEEKRIKMGSKGRELVLTRYNWDEIIKQIIAIYGRLAG